MSSFTYLMDKKSHIGLELEYVNDEFLIRILIFNFNIPLWQDTTGDNRYHYTFPYE